jgi:hypothetical protein
MSMGLILSPPLIPYSPLQSEYFESQEEMLPPSLLVPFNDDIFHSSPTIWNELFSDPFHLPSFLDKIKQDLDSSPVKVVHTETKFMANLKVETPLTPVSTRSKHFEGGVYPFVNTNLTIPLTPSSPPVDTRRLEAKLFNENLTAETSLRLAVPELLSPLPRVWTFPFSMFAVFIGEDGLGCDGIAKSILDQANDESKWQPFIMPSRTIDFWSEEVEGDWEGFVDYTGSNFDDWGVFVLMRNVTIEADEILEVWRSDDADLGGREQEQSEFSGILDVVRKRKAVGGETHLDARQHESKRQKYSQHSRVGEFMTLHGHKFHRVPNEEIPETMMIRKYSV